MARAAAGVRANFFAAGALFLKPCSLPTFFKFVEENFPDQLESYRRRYGTSAFVSAEYRNRVAQIVDAVCRQYKLGRRLEKKTPASAAPGPELVQIQPWLPF